MTGSTGEFFALVPKAVSFAIIASLVECLLILPPHFLDWPGARNLTPEKVAALHKDPAFMVKLKQWADALVLFSLRNRMLCLGSVFAAFVLAMVILGVSMSGAANLIRIKFFPDDYNMFYVDIQGPPSTSINQVNERLVAISETLLDLGPGEVTSTTAMAGMNFTEDYETLMGAGRGHINIQLPAKEDQSYDDPLAQLERVRELVMPHAEGGWDVRVWPEKGGPPQGKAINIRVLGPDHAGVQALADDVMGFIKDSDMAPWLVDLAADTGTPSRIFRFLPRQERIAEYGLTTARVAALAGGVLDGRFVGEYRLADEDVDLRLKISADALDSPEDALDIPVVMHDTSPLRLGDLCGVAAYSEPGQLNRFQGQRAITVTANIKPGAPVSAQGVVRRVQSHYRDVQGRYPGATLNFAGEFESTGRSFQSLAQAFLLALLIIYIILACQFQSYVQPAVILSAVVFALTGVVLGVFFTRSLFTVNSFIATVGVTGVVVNDSLVLLDFVNKLYKQGLSRTEAVREGVRIRLRPILLTTLTTTLGLLPMALGIPAYSVVWGSMATTFVTGLCTATALTLFVVPVLWDIMEGMRLKLQKGQKAT
jgi:HAE1 family hydrophobic/amphiphilic exporter-1